MPDADIVLLDGVGHYPQLEDAGAVLRAYLEFRDRVGHYRLRRNDAYRCDGPFRRGWRYTCSVMAVFAAGREDPP